MTYRIDAALDPEYREPDHLGLNVHDFFEPDVLDEAFATADEAEQAARDAYLGVAPDNHDNPVGVTWEIVEADA